MYNKGGSMPPELLKYFQSKEGREMASQGAKMLMSYGGKMALNGTTTGNPGDPKKPTEEEVAQTLAFLQGATRDPQGSDPATVVMSPERAAKELDTMGFTTAVDNTSIGKTIPVPPSRGPIVIKKEDPVQPETPERPADMIPIRRLDPQPLPVDKPGLQQPTPLPGPAAEDRKFLFDVGSLGHPRVKYGSRDGKMVYPDPISEANLYLQLHNQGYKPDQMNDTPLADPKQEMMRQALKTYSKDPAMNALMRGGMSAEEAALRVAMNKTSYQDQKNFSSDDIYQMALDGGGVDLFNFIEGQKPLGVRTRVNYNPYGVFDPTTLR